MPPPISDPFLIILPHVNGTCIEYNPLYFLVIALALFVAIHRSLRSYALFTLPHSLCSALTRAPSYAVRWPARTCTSRTITLPKGPETPAPQRPAGEAAEVATQEVVPWAADIPGEGEGGMGRLRRWPPPGPTRRRPQVVEAEGETTRPATRCSSGTWVTTSSRRR